MGGEFSKHIIMVDSRREASNWCLLDLIECVTLRHSVISTSWKPTCHHHVTCNETPLRPQACVFVHLCTSHQHACSLLLRFLLGSSKTAHDSRYVPRKRGLIRWKKKSLKPKNVVDDGISPYMVCGHGRCGCSHWANLFIKGRRWRATKAHLRAVGVHQSAKVSNQYWEFWWTGNWLRIINALCNP